MAAALPLAERQRRDSQAEQEGGARFRHRFRYQDPRELDAVRDPVVTVLVAEYSGAPSASEVTQNQAPFCVLLTIESHWMPAPTDSGSMSVGRKNAIWDLAPGRLS